MMNIRVDERFSYVELEVFGAYQLDRMQEVLDAMRRLADANGHFSQLEIHHGKPQNAIKLLTKFVQENGSPDDYAFMKKMRKYALVSDNPPVLLRIAAAFSSSGAVQIRIFPMHERDHARQWIEAADAG